MVSSAHGLLNIFITDINSSIIIVNSKVYLPRASITVTNLVIMLRPFGLLPPKGWVFWGGFLFLFFLRYFAFQSVDFERTGRRLYSRNA